jgi:hypothetical protein
MKETLNIHEKIPIQIQKLYLSYGVAFVNTTQTFLCTEILYFWYHTLIFTNSIPADYVHSFHSEWYHWCWPPPWFWPHSDWEWLGYCWAPDKTLPSLEGKTMPLQTSIKHVINLTCTRTQPTVDDRIRELDLQWINNPTYSEWLDQRQCLQWM